MPFWVFCLHTITLTPASLRKHQARRDLRNWTIRFEFIETHIINLSYSELSQQLNNFIQPPPQQMAGKSKVLPVKEEISIKMAKQSTAKRTKGPIAVKKTKESIPIKKTEEPSPVVEKVSEEPVGSSLTAELSLTTEPSLSLEERVARLGQIDGTEASDLVFSGLDTLLDALRREALEQEERIKQASAQFSTTDGMDRDRIKAMPEAELQALSSNVLGLKQCLERLSVRNQALKEAIQETVAVPLAKDAALFVDNQRQVVSTLAQIFAFLGSAACEDGLLWTFFPDAQVCSVALTSPGTGFQILKQKVNFNHATDMAGAFVTLLELWHEDPEVFTLLQKLECTLSRDENIAIFTAHVDVSKSGRNFLDSLYPFTHPIHYSSVFL